MLKKFRPVSLILFAGVLCFPKTYAETETVKPEVKFSQQSGKITGTVEDDFGPVAGASVVVKGTTNGNITDMDGKFNLEVSPNAVLVITFIGYVEQQIPVGNQTSFSINLKEDSQALEEVVVVGYGTQKKVNLTG